MKPRAQFAWEIVEDDPLAYASHDTHAAAPASSRGGKGRGRAERLAFLVSTLLILAGLLHLWRTAKVQQHAGAPELAAALDSVMAPHGRDSLTLLPPTMTQVSRRGDLATVRARAAGQGHSAIVLRKTAQGWQRIAPAGSAWGEQQEFVVGTVAVRYWEKDAAVVRAAAVQADTRMAYIRRMLRAAVPTTPLEFVVAPDAWGMVTVSNGQHQIVFPATVDGTAARIAHLTEALLRPQIAAALHELAGPGVATAAGRPLLAALEDWLVVNAYPRLAEDTTALAPARPSSATTADARTALTQRLASGTASDLAAMIDELVATRGYAGLSELLRGFKQG